MGYPLEVAFIQKDGAEIHQQRAQHKKDDEVQTGLNRD
jgi:hypothetical protein